ncbi:MAG: hypothetical protein ACI31M_04400 [Bacilli bacterium]
MNKEDVNIYIPTKERVIDSEMVIVEQKSYEVDYNELSKEIIKETLNQLENRESALILKPISNKYEV